MARGPMFCAMGQTRWHRHKERHGGEGGSTLLEGVQADKDEEGDSSKESIKLHIIQKVFQLQLSFIFWWMLGFMFPIDFMCMC